INAQKCVGENRIAENCIARGIGSHNGDAIRAASGDDVAGAGGTSHGIAGSAGAESLGDQHARQTVAQNVGPVDVRANAVALDHIQIGNVILGIDANTIRVSGDHIGGNAVGGADDVEIAIDENAVKRIADDEGS